MSEDANSRISKLESKVEEHSKLLDKQSDKNDLQVEMNTLLKLQIQSNEKQNTQIEKIGETLSSVNKNLTELNISQQQLQTEVAQIGNRVGVIEQKADENKIIPTKLIFKILGYVGGFISTLVLGYLFYKFGWNSNN